MVFALFGLLVGCAPTILGSDPSRPYTLDDYPTFTATAGQSFFGQRRYNLQRWDASNRISPSFSVSLSSSGFQSNAAQSGPDLRVIFGNFVEVCARERTPRRVVNGLSIILVEAPVGWQLGLEGANFVLECDAMTQQRDGTRVQRFVSALELVYRFSVPSSLTPGTYTVRWKVLQENREIASEERRFVITSQ